MEFDLRVIVWIVAMGITAGTPLLFAAVGEVLTERSGVLNLGLEGLMLMGAVVGFMVSCETGDKWLALAVVVGVSAFLGLVLSFLIVTLRANQIATGIAFTIFCSGLSTLIGKPYLGAVATSTFKKISFSLLEDLPLVHLLLNQDILVYLAFCICLGAWFFLYKTKPGLHLRAVGESPETLDSLGVNVFVVRYIFTIVGSVLTGIGGAYLSLAYTPAWIEGMASGRGWLAIALVNFALWDPVKAIFGAYLFGVFYAFSFRIEAMGIAVPSYFLRMIPYILPILILILMSLRLKNQGSIAPKTLSFPYIREGK
jgi:simple sugar transport system permease protein